MKNKLFINTGISLLLTLSLSAGESNAISISDLKEVTYNLIIDLQKIKNLQNLDKHNLNSYVIDMNNSLNKKIKDIDVLITDTNETINDIKKRSVLIRKGDSELDKYIASYVNSNIEYLPENCK